MASDNTGTIIKIGALAGAAYLAYSQGWLSFLGLSPTPSVPVPAPSAPVTPPPSATGTTATTAAAPAGTLDTLHNQIFQAAPVNATLDADNWGWYLNNALSAIGKGPAPDPVPIFGARPFPAMTLADYWAKMAPALKTQLGLSGLGRFAGMGAVRQRYIARVIRRTA